jgi:hypothetical protein
MYKNVLCFITNSTFNYKTMHYNNEWAEFNVLVTPYFEENRYFSEGMEFHSIN